MSKERIAELPRVCEYCENAVKIADDEFVLCQHKGVVDKGYCCRRFSYDILKRIPLPPARLITPDPNEFNL